MINYDTIVIGGGASGMLAAYSAAKRGKKVCLTEKNRFLGKKLLITGKGRCNVTNSAPIEEFILNTNVNANFLYSAFYTFTNEDLISLLENSHLKLKTERGGRVFPQSDRASDVRDTLENLLKKQNVDIVFADVSDIKKDNGRFEVISDKGKIYSDSVIIATGGLSYPQTGSTGDGYKFALKFGHTISDLKASLVPLVTKEKNISDLMGLSLKNIEINLYENGKKVYTDFGEMLFTHFGLSGPVILSASSHMNDDKKYSVSVDLKPKLDFKKLDERILRDFNEQKNKDFINSLDMLLPKKLIAYIVERSGIDPRCKVNSITKEKRYELVRLLKDLRFDIKGKRDISEAIITSGGVNVKEIDSSTMQSKICKGLFFAGEVIDVDAYTGGFNLQIAFSTGYMAGMNV